jgi:exodeoxyribonuclease I
MAAPATSFFWHDYETFGRSARRDRPAQFAGVRTDAELNEIGAPVMVYCQPAPDSLPDPESVLLTGILPQLCLERGVPEQAFAAAIEAELAAPGTIGVGYNSIRFDDEFTRFLFWRNLIDPYAREWRNGCGRWDLLDTMRCTWALRPEGIEWPLHDDGRPSFKLEHLTQANGLTHEAAHDALSDVRATVALARILKTRKARLWDFCLGLREKSAVQAELLGGGPVLHISGMYPASQGCMAIVAPLAPHPTNRNEVIVWDLAFDPVELLSLDAEVIRQRLFTRQEDLPEGLTRLPLKTIHINKSPIVIKKLATLTPERAEAFGIDKALALRHAQNVARVAAPMLGVWDRVFARQAAAEAVDVDADLYGGFVGDEDRRQLERLRKLTPEALAKSHPVFRDERLDELLFRFRARNHLHTLSEEELARWLRHCGERLHGGGGGALTLAAFFDQIDQLAETADERGQALLAALYDYAESIAPAL